ncbi:MAG: site-specific integrase [Lachnospiraceae bacterium]|nr:site-specific integrase [Lachnospiraceae bacterium]
MATVTPRKNKEGVITSFSIRVYIGRDSNDKAIYQNTSFKVEPTWSEKTALKKATAYANTFERDLLSGVISNERRRFDDYCNYVLELKKQSGTKRSTLDRYHILTKRIYPVLGHLRVKDIRVDHLNRFYMDLLNTPCENKHGQTLSANTVHHYHRLICTVLEQAYREDLVPANVALKATLPKINKKEPRTLTPDELKIISSFLLQKGMKWRAAIALLMDTGFRRGEMLGIQWSDINFEKGTITVNKTIMQSIGEGTYVETPKTKSSVRTIGLTDACITILKEHQLFQKEERLRLGSYYHDQGYVFTQENGNPMAPDSVTKFCNKQLSKLCGFYITPHMFRHAHASILLGNGIPAVAVAQRLGHSQVSTTLNIYAHALPEADALSVKTLESVLYQEAK